KMFAVFHGPEAKPGPEGRQAALRMPNDAGIALLLTKFQPGVNQLNSGAAFTELLADRDALELREIREEAQTDATDRFVSHIGQQMRGAEIVAIIFLFIGAFLLS